MIEEPLKYPQINEINETQFSYSVFACANRGPFVHKTTHKTRPPPFFKKIQNTALNKLEQSCYASHQKLNPAKLNQHCMCTFIWRPWNSYPRSDHKAFTGRHTSLFKNEGYSSSIDHMKNCTDELASAVILIIVSGGKSTKWTLCQFLANCSSPIYMQLDFKIAFQLNFAKQKIHLNYKS